jgi:predicted RNA binding protein YcfA (HicA-like mRNA interferase family)
MLKILREDGWRRIKSKRGDHRQFEHPVKPGKVTVDGKPGDDVSMDNWYSMLRQAGLR